MNSVVVRTLFSLIVPGGLVVFSTAILLYLGILDKSLSALVHIYPYLVAVAGMLLRLALQPQSLDFRHSCTGSGRQGTTFVFLCRY